MVFSGNGSIENSGALPKCKVILALTKRFISFFSYPLQFPRWLKSWRGEEPDQDKRASWTHNDSVQCCVRAREPPRLDFSGNCGCCSWVRSAEQRQPRKGQLPAALPSIGGVPSTSLAVADINAAADSPLSHWSALFAEKGGRGGYADSDHLRNSLLLLGQ